ncbi:hypothetical protein [Niabella hibiscisoli]|nr:hypothetical protein [Niabella hibiscisoli]
MNSVGTSYSRQKTIKDSIQKVKDLAKLKEQKEKILSPAKPKQ